MDTWKFTTKAEAKRLTGLSYLGSVASSSKIAKGLKYNEATFILYLAPANQSGYEVCPMRTEGCTAACLHESGHNRIDTKLNRINNARIKKTRLFFEQKEFFMGWIIAEIQSAKKKAEKNGQRFSVRLNGTSDIEFNQFKFEGKPIYELMPEVQFYDYTKVYKRMRRYDEIPNYDLTFSFSGENETETVSTLITGAGRVAVVFEGPELPTSWKGFPVVDGDAYDMRYLDPKGVVVGLRFKKVRNKIDVSDSNFIIPNNSKDNVFM